MGSRFQCFIIEPTDRTERKLRRYSSSSGNCTSKWGYHNGHTPFGEGRCSSEAREGRYGKTWKWHDEVEDPSHDDPWWPTKCDDCPYVFTAEDKWQVWREVIYVRKDTGEFTTIRDCAPGAMWDAADWYPEIGPDGHSWCVALPPNGGMDYWHMDGPTAQGGKWTRTGEAPNLTATPSILTPSTTAG